MAIPTIILTGFLGSGKTTLLKKLLVHAQPKKSMVIENEFGKESIDASLLAGSANMTMDLSSGCLCHDLAYEFLELLGSIVKIEREEGLDLLFIETSGISDPALIAEPFEKVELIKKHFSLNALVTVVNPETVEDEVADSELARQQISSADVLYISRSEHVTSKYLKQLEEGLLRTINPFARIITDMEEGAEEVILDHQRKDHKSLSPLRGSHNDIKSITLKLSGSFDKGQLSGLLTILLLVQGSFFYRIKGWVWLENEDKPKLLNALRQSFVFEDLDESVANTIPKQENTIVLIGKSLQKDRMEKKFKQCLIKQVSIREVKE